jgi:hypothetical protein
MKTCIDFVINGQLNLQPIAHLTKKNNFEH